MATAIRATFNRVKPYSRWFILALTLGFIVHALSQNWQQILTLRFTDSAIALLITATGATLLAHIWSAWVWYWIMQLLDAPPGRTWVIVTYLKTNLAKYLPGNVWHFVRRVQSLRLAGTSTGAAITGVILEPLLMSAAALAIVILSLPSTPLQAAILLAVLIGVHPRILNPILKRLATLKVGQIAPIDSPDIPELSHYPIKPFLGEILFVVFRGIGFLLAFASLTSLELQDGWILIGSFSLAWLVGLVIPGAPGGLGVFEATALTLLSSKFPVATVLGAVALYRLIGTLAEALGAGLAVIDEKLNALPVRAIADVPAKRTPALPSITSASLGERE